jgi:hypothetical protein
MKWEVHVAHTEEETEVYKVLVANPEGRRPLGRSWCRWKNGFKVDLRQMD